MIALDVVDKVGYTVVVVAAGFVFVMRLLHPPPRKRR